MLQYNIMSFKINQHNILPAGWGGMDWIHLGSG
jgi:hypothetical protein